MLCRFVRIVEVVAAIIMMVADVLPMERCVPPVIGMRTKCPCLANGEGLPEHGSQENYDREGTTHLCEYNRQVEKRQPPCLEGGASNREGCLELSSSLGECGKTAGLVARWKVKADGQAPSPPLTQHIHGGSRRGDNSKQDSFTLMRSLARPVIAGARKIALMPMAYKRVCQSTDLVAREGRMKVASFRGSSSISEH